MKLQFNNNKFNNSNTNMLSLQSSNAFKNRLIEQERIIENIRNNMNKDEKTDNNKNLENSRLRWGPSTWYLFHTLAEKIKPEYFMSIKNELLDIVKSICLHLPCPSCAQHASQYIKNLNYNSIQNKEDLKIFFLNFHNMVNERNKKPLLNINDVNDKYSKAKTINVIHNFITVFQYKNKGFNMIANEMQRQRQIDIYKSWFNKNIYMFDV